MIPSRTHRAPLRLSAVMALLVTLLFMPLSACAAQGWTDDLLRVVLLRDYNTRVVLLGAMLLGVTAGLIGVFTLLRKRALVGDAASHATLPGIGIAFIVMTLGGGTGKSLPGLLIGATLAGLAGMGSILVIRRWTRLKEDAALGIVLSVFFGLGIALMGVIQKMNLGHAAGLETFLYGKTASMLAHDAWLMSVAAIVVLFLTISLFKEFTLLCFDSEFAAAQGWPVTALDGILMALIVCTVVIGLQAVGLVLIIALLIIPPAAARFWTHDLRVTLILSSVFGALSGLFGAAISALAPRMPAGALIVVVAGVLFLISLFFGSKGGLLHGWIRMVSLRRRTLHQHLMRAMYEWSERHGRDAASFDWIVQERSWNRVTLSRLLARSIRRGWICRTADDGYRLTQDGETEARRIVRNHRLWELYLITHAHVAPSHVDHGADKIEHVLGAALVDRLEAVLKQQGRGLPPSPHYMNTLNGQEGRA